MKLLKDKFKETLLSVSPILIIVLLLSLFIVDVGSVMLWSFILGTILVILGLTLFLYGIETGMEPAGNMFGGLIANSRSGIFIAFISFILGFSVTIAEPDLLILGQQMENATDGILGSGTVVFLVSIGVGLMIAFGVFRLLQHFPLKYFFLLLYIVVFGIALFTDNHSIAMAFDASGATTGALTTPFVLVISISIASRIDEEQADENSFGLVGAMSTGPILAVFFLMLITNSELIAPESLYDYSNLIWEPIINAMIPTLLESLLALIPIVLLFIVVNYYSFKKEFTELSQIFLGFIYTIVGLALFLVGVHEGFMDMGHLLGAQIAGLGNVWLILIGFILGLFIVLAEPAVQVLGDQVAKISNGKIQKRFLLSALSFGVGIAVSLSMLRIISHDFSVWHVLLPGFILAIALSFFSPPIFTGIAFDAGGVASGPMAVTFILAFAQGASDFLPSADALDAFGVIAFVALTPIIMVETLGVIYKYILSSEK